jgi:1-acyl-sn-glycerol-3-phosphate acyltransferase
MFLLMFVYAAVYFLDDRKRTLIAYRFNRAFMSVWMPICGYRVTVDGWDKVDPNKTYMFVCNHSNMLDLPVCGYFLQHYYKSLAKKELKKVPFFGFLIRISCILVDRSSAESRRRSTQTIIDRLRRGTSIFIFPEGTRNTTKQPMKNFYSGAFKTAVMAQVPVMPIVYLNVRGLQPVGTWRLYPGTIHVKVLDPIETAGMTTADVAALQEKIYKQMEDSIKQEDKGIVNGLFKD